MDSHTDTAKQSDPSIAKCVVAGGGLKLAQKTLRVAFPKKKQEPLTSVLISGRKDALTFSLPGASCDIPALVTEAFACEIPWLTFKTSFTSKHEDHVLFRFEFSAGWFKFGDVLVTSDSIVMRPIMKEQSVSDKKVITDSDSYDSKTSMNSQTSEIDLADVPMELPLLRAHFYVKKYGVRRFIGNRPFIRQQIQVERLLNQAERLLAPVGISRTDIERIIDEKFGGVQFPLPAPPK